MASTEFPEVEREEKTGGGFVQPSLEDWSTESMWDLNRKLLYASEHYDQRIENLNQKVVADVQAQQMFEIAKQERMLALKMASQELLERQRALLERQDQHASNMARIWQSVDHQATLNNIDYGHTRNTEVLELRTIEPKETLDVASEAIADAASKGAQVGARAMVDSGQTSIGNLAGYSAVRQVADVNSINTMAAYQALTNQVAELTLVVQALSKKE